VNCSNTAFAKAETDQDIFTFANLTQARILPGATCFVTACYIIEYDGGDPEYILTPMRNCTIRGEQCRWLV
jgi:hypothetical protein